MSRFTPQHYVAILLAVAGVGTQIQSAHSWSEILSPSFIGGSLVSISGTLVALFAPKPEKPS